MSSFPQIPLIDGDIIVYRAGFATKEGEPVENAWFTTKRQLEKIIDSFDRGLEYRLFLTGEGNYRDEVATILPYKGNRKDSKKPIYYQEIRDYMTKWWRAEIVNGREADDALGCAQQADKTCIVSIDKDLLMIPGWHYNWVKDKHFHISELQGCKNFYLQLLTGDRTDNIPGIKGIGPKRAEKALKGCRTKEDMERVVVGMYKKEFGRYWQEAMEEIGKLLWIQREGGEEWQRVL